MKRPGLSYVQRSILGDDYMLWLVASIAVASAPMSHAVGLLLLVLSFWTIYELGYVDNDRIGERYEADPTLTAEFHQVPVATSFVQAWVWACGFGAAGVAILEGSSVPSISGFAGWVAVLVAMLGVYLLYNRVDKGSRIWLYALLQLARAAAFLAVVPVTAFGAMALAAHAISRWFIYFLYRIVKRDWPLEVPTNVIRLLTFGLLAAPLGIAMATTLDAANMLTLAIVLGWFSFRSGPRLSKIFSNARFITSQKSVGTALALHASNTSQQGEPIATPSVRH